MRQITLRGMRFHALVGVLPHERELLQPIEIDLMVRVHGATVVDYRLLYAIAADVLGAGPIDYLEEIGDRIARAALGSSPAVRAARVAVRKPHVALPGPLAHAEVVVEHRASAVDDG